MARFEDCMGRLKAAAKGTISEDGLQALLEQLELRRQAIERRSNGTVSGGSAYRAAAKLLGEEERQAALIKERNAWINYQRRVERRQRIEASGDPALGIQSTIAGVNTPIAGGRMSAEADWKSLSKTWTGGLTQELQKENLFGVARSGQVEREWVNELAELNKGKNGQPGITKSAPGLAIAKIVQRWQQVAKQALNDAGAWIDDYAGYVTRTAHDANAILKAGYDQWRETALQNLDKDRTFGGIADPEKFLRGVYGGLSTGIHMTEEFRGFKDPAFNGPGNLAKRMSEQRELHWLDADHWLAYQKEFGTASIIDQVNAQLDRAARSTALMKMWGTNPRAEFDNDLAFFRETWRDKSPAKALALRSKEWFMSNEFGYLDGTNNIPANELGARVASTARLLQSTARLGGVAFTHLASVLWTKPFELRYHGVGLLQGYSDTIASLFRGRGSGETRELTDLLTAGVEGMQRDLLARFNPDDTLPGTLSKVAGTYFKWTGLTYLIDGQKTGASYVMSRHLGRMIDRNFAALPEETQRSLRVYGIKPAEWEKLRQAQDPHSIDGRSFVTPDLARRMTDDAIKPAAREDLAQRLALMFHDIADRSIVTPGVFEKALLLGGTRPGSAAGEVLRFLAQFKTWPVAVVRQQFGREWNGGSGRTAGTIAGIVHMALAATVFGYMRMVLSDLSKGLQPRDPTSMATWGAAMAQGGGFGILGDYLFGEYSRFGHSFAESLAGPVLGTGASTIVDMWNDLKSGKAKDVPPELFRTALDNMPFINMFYTRAALNYFFAYQVEEALNPGYLRRLEQRQRQQQGREYWLRPTQAVR
jgi:hypothetical protein